MTLMSALAGCARPTSSPIGDRAAVVDQLDRLSQRIGGTPRQRTAGEVLQYHAYQDPIRDCMAKANFTYEPPRFTDPYRGRSVIHMGIGTGQWLAPLGEERIGVTDTAEIVGPQEDAGPSANYRSLSQAEKDKFETALTGCIPRDTPEVNFPPAYYPLTEKFNQMLTAASKNEPVKAAGKQYPDCMAKGNFKVDKHDDLIALIQARIGSAQPPKPNHAADAKWSSAVALEREAARLDTVCRKPAYDAALEAVAPAASEFERTEAAELTLVAQQWDDMEKRAAAYPEFPR
ncbi:hypothetical protein ACH495_19295 [Micromonospora sp. NPDC018662]|uniref:hypothetical protein n=1 Tax=Micromonospora sp. NPDC018662 TaxID=3364238 RepID=UPI003793E258